MPTLHQRSVGSLALFYQSSHACLLSRALQGRARRRRGGEPVGWLRIRKGTRGTRRGRRRRGGGWWGPARRRRRAAAGAGGATRAGRCTWPSSPAGASCSSTTRRPGAASAATSSSCPDPTASSFMLTLNRCSCLAHSLNLASHSSKAAAASPWLVLATGGAQS
jgi:hypothetical protein